MTLMITPEGTIGLVCTKCGEVTVLGHAISVPAMMAVVTDHVCLANAMAEIEKGQQLGGHSPSPEAMDRARRVLTGEITIEQARAELGLRRRV